MIFVPCEQKPTEPRIPNINEEHQSARQKEMNLKKQELDLKERELRLKEREKLNEKKERDQRTQETYISAESDFIPSERTYYSPGEYLVNPSRSYFYKQPNYATMKKAYCVSGEVVYVQKIAGDFGYVEFVNSSGQKTTGWMLMRELSEF
jgi:hypothetical protein